MGKKDTERDVLEVEYLDPKTAAYKPVQLNFTKFIEELQKKAKLLSNLGSKMSNTYQKIEATSEERAYEFLSKTIEELQSILLKLPALDSYFKHEVPKNQRSFVKGIRIETSALKNTVVKANQKRHEYVSHKEEMEQLKKLGVDTSVE
jgi:MoaA/NifB/PqqE/SkfB family radical SAM enzyme